MWNGIDQDPVRRAAVWFVLFGAVLALLGGAVAGLERAGTPGQPALIGHVEIHDMQEWPQVLRAIKTMLLEKHGIDHVTLQAELPSMAEGS